MRIRLVRNDPAARWRLGLVASGQGYTGRDRLILLHGPRLLGAMLLLLLAGWNASAALLWRRQQTAGYHSVSYADIALPWRWAEMRQAKSRDQIELARSLMENGDDLKALWNLLAAVHRTPANREGTRLLGIVLVRNLMVGEALDYLTKGLEHFEPDMAYMHLLLDTAAQADEHELIQLGGDRLRTPLAARVPPGHGLGAVVALARDGGLVPLLAGTEAGPDLPGRHGVLCAHQAGPRR